MKIQIITDSASDIISPYHENVTVVPMTITFGENSYQDGVTISHKQFYEKLVEYETLPFTSAVSPYEFEKAIDEALETNEGVLVVTMSSKLSGTYQNAMIASADKDNVIVIDSLSVAVGERALIDHALARIDEGKSLKEIADELNSLIPRLRVLALLDTLEYLKKGGRISKTVAFAGGLLNIKPVVTVEEGEVALLGKARGSKQGNNYLSERIMMCGIDTKLPVRLGYTGISDHLLQKYITDSKALLDTYPGELVITTIGATIGTHVGPNAIAIAFFELNPLR